VNLIFSFLGNEDAETEVTVETTTESKAENTPDSNVPNTNKFTNRNSAVALIVNTAKSCPFKYSNKSFMCFYCSECHSEFSQLHQHTITVHKKITESEIWKSVNRLKQGQTIKINFTSLTCRICNANFNDFRDMKVHLVEKHEKPVDIDYDGVFPYKIQKGTYGCILCGMSFKNYALLKRHVNSHFPFYICNHCGASYPTAQNLNGHIITKHTNRAHSCEICQKMFPSAIRKKLHINRVHLKMQKNKCTLCSETFASYNEKVKHLKTVHGKK
jgi:hypothetical protein